LCSERGLPKSQPIMSASASLCVLDVIMYSQEIAHGLKWPSKKYLCNHQLLSTQNCGKTEKYHRITHKTHFPRICVSSDRKKYRISFEEMQEMSNSDICTFEHEERQHSWLFLQEPSPVLACCLGHQGPELTMDNLPQLHLVPVFLVHSKTTKA